MLKKLTDLLDQDSPRMALFTVVGTLACFLLSLAAIQAVSLFVAPGSPAFNIGLATILSISIGTPLLAFVSLRQNQLSRLRQRLAEAVAFDGLTACLNGPTFSALVNAYGMGIEAEPPKGALVIIDADHLELINERFGRSAGDEALRLVAASIRHSVRSGDLVGRLGDDKFGVLLPGASRENAEGVAERIRASVAQAEFRPAGSPYPLTISGGVALFQEEMEFDILFRAADHQVREAKSAGRNKIEVIRLPSRAAQAREERPPTRH